MSSAISKRYAKALVQLGAERDMVERFAAELEKVNAVFASESTFRALMESPTFSAQKKGVILRDLFTSLETSEGIRNFLGLLLEKDRLRYLPQIASEYRVLADELSGILRADVTTASELSKEQHQTIGRALEQQTGKRVVLRAKTDPALIGGIQVAIGGKVFDGSLRTQLKRIEDTLKKG